MAIKNFIFGACALATWAQAAPIETVVEIVTNTHWVTVDCIKTVWLPVAQFSTTTVASTEATTTTAVTTTTSEYVAPVPTTFSTSSSSSTTTTTTTTTTPAPVPTTTAVTTPVYVAPVPTTTPSVYVAPVVVTTPSTSAYVPPTTSAAPVQVTTPETTAAAAPQSTTAAAAVAGSGSGPGSGSGSGTGGNFASVQASASNNCENKGSACEGDVTHWDGGLGACGWNVDTASDMAIALPVGFMGSQSNGNPYCGRSVTLYNPATGTTVQAKVGDKCMGCTGRAIDCTDALFKAITDGKGDGRESGIQWWLN